MTNTSSNVPLNWYCRASALRDLAQVSKYQPALQYTQPPRHHPRCHAGRGSSQSQAWDTRIFPWPYMAEAREVIEMHLFVLVGVFPGRQPRAGGSGEHPAPWHGKTCVLSRGALSRNASPQRPCLNSQLFSIQPAVLPQRNHPIWGCRCRTLTPFSDKVGNYLSR